MRESENFDVYKKTKFYWLLTIGMIFIGGIWTTLYGIENVSAILAVNIGASAPALISVGFKAGTITPRKEQAKVPEIVTKDITFKLHYDVTPKPTMSNFLAGK